MSTRERAQATATILLERAERRQQVISSDTLVERDIGIFACKNSPARKKFDQEIDRPPPVRPLLP
ncbi:hypothetical protein K4A87_03715 [Xanthomonas fragariae]|nr:hypothetical protein K4A87_03715 [Xanthomonas fragariae]